MRVLMVIDNNIVSDTRVKRHISLLAEKGATVHVCARPLPDRNFGVSLPNVTHSFFENGEITLNVDNIRKKAEELGVFEILWAAFPGIIVDQSHYKNMKDIYRGIQKGILELPWWKDVRDAITNDNLGEYNEHMSMLWTFEFFLQWAEYTANHEADVIYCNDLSTLLCGVVHKKRWNSKLIYDAHEIYCDLVPGGFSRLFKDTMALYEYNLCKNIDSLIGVSQSQVDWMKKTYGLNKLCNAIPNCSELREIKEDVSKEYNQPIRVYYHGASDEWRGLDNIVDALVKVEGIELILRCLESDNLNIIRKKVEQNGLADRVKFFDPVCAEEIVTSCYKDGDIGIHACDVRTCLNIGVALSNKFIEYLKAGLPVITSPLHEQARIIEEYNAGYVLNNNSIDSITDVFNKIIADKDKLSVMSKGAKKASVELFDWNNYKNILWGIITDK